MTDTTTIDMVLYCPVCGMQHIDKDNTEDVRIEAAERGFEHGSRDWEDWVEAHTWTNPPHRSHLCSGCGHIWRPADVCTNGVEAVKTRGAEDSPLAVGGRVTQVTVLENAVEYHRGLADAARGEARVANLSRVGALARMGKLVAAARMVTLYRYNMSYNDAYFGEAPGLFKTRIAELERALPTIYPASTIKAAPMGEGFVPVDEVGEGQNRHCFECGAEPGQSCSDVSGREHGNAVHPCRHWPDAAIEAITGLRDEIEKLETQATKGAITLPPLPLTKGLEPDCPHPPWITTLLTGYATAAVLADRQQRGPCGPDVDPPPEHERNPT